MKKTAYTKDELRKKATSIVADSLKKGADKAKATDNTRYIAQRAQDYAKRAPTNPYAVSEERNEVLSFLQKRREMREAQRRQEESDKAINSFAKKKNMGLQRAGIDDLFGSGKMTTAGTRRTAGPSARIPETEDTQPTTIYTGKKLDQQGKDILKNGFSNYLRDLGAYNKQKKAQKEEDVRSGKYLGSWVGGRTKESEDYLAAGNVRGRIKQEQRDKKLGKYNKGDDITMMDDEGLSNYYSGKLTEQRELQDEVNNLINKLPEYEQEGAWQPISDKTKDYIKNQKTIINGPGYSDEDKDHARKELRGLYSRMYDSLNGFGAWEQATAGKTEDEIRTLESEFENTINGVGGIKTELENKSSRLRTIDSEVQAAENQRKINQEYNELMTGGEPAGESIYEPGYDPMADWESETSKIKSNVQRGATYRRATVNDTSIFENVDAIYSYLTGGRMWELYGGDQAVSPRFKYADFMDDNEILKFTEYYEAGKPDEAMAFMDGLQTALSQRYRPYEEYQQRELARQYPFMSSVATFGATTLQPMEAIANVIDGIFGDGKQMRNYAGNTYMLTRMKNTVRQQVGSDLDETARFFYNAAMSAGDSAINAFIAKGLGLTGKAAQAATLTLFGTQAFQGSMQENLEKSNGDFGWSFAEAMIDTLIETATEVFSVEQLLSDPTKFYQYILKNAGAEASEEFAGSALGPYIKQLLGHKNEWTERADEIYAAGGFEDGSGQWIKVENFDEAKRQAMKEWNHEIATSTLSGAVSTGGGMFVGGVQNLQNRANMRRIGENINNYNPNFSMNYSQNNTENVAEGQTEESAGTPSMMDQGRANLQKLVDAAGGLKEGSMSGKLAQKIQEKQEKGRKVSNREIGELAVTIARESDQETAEIMEDTIAKSAAEALKGNELTDAEAEKIGGIIAKAQVQGRETLTKEEEETLRTSKSGTALYKSFGEAGNEVAEGIRKSVEENTRSVAEIRDETVNMAVNRQTQKTEETSSVKDHMASEEEIRQATGERTGGKREAVVDGQFARIGKMVETTDENGEKTVGFEVTVDGQTRTVPASDVYATDFGTAAVIFKAKNNPRMFSAKYTNTMLAALELGETKNAADFIEDAIRIRIAGFTGMQRPVVNMPSKIADMMYNASVDEHRVNRQSQTADGQRNAGKPGSGMATFNGAEYGTEAWSEQIGKLNISQKIRDQMDAAAALAQKAGIELTFVDNATVAGLGKEGSKQRNNPERTYGWENRSGITLNVEGMDLGMIDESGTKEATGEHHLLVTLGHEMTHWLQRNSLEGYNRLERFVMSEMSRTMGTNLLNKRIQDVMQWRGLNLEDAISEMVADGCDQILANEEVARHIEETDKGLFNEIKGFVKNLVERVKNAVKGMDRSRSIDAEAMIRSTNQLAKIWLGAYDEALTATTQENIEQSGENANRNSEAETGEGGFEEDKYFNRIINNRKNHEGSGYIKVGKVAEGGALNQVGIPAEIIRYDKSKIRYNLEKHESWLTPGLLAEIPDILRNPVLITEYKEPNTITVFGKRIINERPMMVGVVVTKGRTGLLIQPKVRTVNIRNDYDKLINDESVLYITTNKKEAQNWFQVLGINAPIGGKQYGLIRRIQLQDTDVNTRKSEAEIDSEYMTAVNDGNTEAMQELVDEAAERAFAESKIRDENGKLLKVYHGTSENFTVFDRTKGRANMDIQGMFFSPWELDAEGYGENVRAYYLNITNPAPEQVAFRILNKYKGQNEAGIKARDELITMGYDGVSYEGYEYIAFNPEQIKSADPVTYDNKGKTIPLSERFNTEKDDIRWSQAEEDIKNIEDDSRSPIVSDHDKVGRVSGAPSTKNILNDRIAVVNRNKEYQDAVERGDLKHATEMLMEKLRNTEGIIPIIAPEWHSGSARETAELLKTGDAEAIATAAKEMSKYVPDNAVLIPMPPHEGKVRENTSTLLLANAISELTGRPVVIALEGEAHESRQKAKGEDRTGPLQDELGFRKTNDIPEGMFPIFIDNTVGSGVTADAARQAIGGGITLALTKTIRSAGIKGLKNITVTYESKSKGGGLVPFDQRLDVSVRDVRYSQADETSMDAQSWMAGLTPGELQTEDERTLLQAFKDLRMKISLSIKRQLDYREKIRKLEASAESLTPQEREDLSALRVKLQAQQEKQAKLEQDLYKVTSSEGYAGMMYQQNMILSDFLYGRTQDEVVQTVNDLMNQVRTAGEQLERQAEELRRIEQTEIGKAARAFYQSQAMKNLARAYKKQYASSMSIDEISGRLATLFTLWGDRTLDGVEKQSDLRTKEEFRDVAYEAEQLATDLIRTQRGMMDPTGILGGLRGRTIEISRDTMNELKSEGEYKSIAALRNALKGTGIRIQISDKVNTLETDELEYEVPGIQTVLYDNNGERITSNTDLVYSLVDTMQALMRNEEDLKLHDADIDGLTEDLLIMASTKGAYQKGKTGSTTEAQLMKNIRDMVARSGKSAEEIMRIRETLKQAEGVGERAAGLTRVLQQDVRQAINYYNKTAEYAAKEEKRKVKEGLIAQLKSDHAKDLVKQEEKFREQMKRDRRARELAEDNKALRGKINTVAKRVSRLITAETDKKNIPQDAKPLAKQLLQMLVTHDYMGYRKVLKGTPKQIMDLKHTLDIYDQRDGAFDPDTDLEWLVVAPGTEYEDAEARDRVYQDLMNIETGLLEYRLAEGQGNTSLNDRKAALKKVQEAVSEIYGVIRARQEAEVGGRKVLIDDLAMRLQDDMAGSRFKGEWTGITKGVGAVKGAVIYGNMTPEYFFKNLRNGTMDLLYDEYHKAENRAGLEIRKAQERLAKIAEETGYGTWDQEKRMEIHLTRGGTVRMTLGEIMSLYATWQREVMNQVELNGPERSYHLELGGFYVEEDPGKVAGRQLFKRRAHRVTEDDIAMLENLLTAEQKSYISQVVSYLSNEMSELGNEASMRMFGIKKYAEKYYFPFESWSGQKAVKSNKGAGGTQENRIAHSSFSKRRINNARNALMIRDFTDVAVKHINQMINYNTFAPAIETMQRVMNTQLETGEGDDVTKRTMREAFGEAYGREALDYFDNFQKDINGGAVRMDRTLWDRLLTTFRKSAVAGSMSVAAQQPLSYIRAATMMNPKYLAKALNPATFKGSREEMEKHSGVAVIKRMGKFDMGFGQSAIGYMRPEAKTGKGRAVYNWVSEKATALPELMDAATWTRMWTAVKMEQADLHPDLDTKSEEFMNIVTDRFNTLMRRTQVYDSALVRSRNMRSVNPIMKGLTSFMAEPTLTANVLADAVANSGEKGGKLRLIRASALFLVSAAAQAAVKGIVGAGRSPDDKKTLEENFYYKFWYNFFNEADPLGLIPGYGDLIEVLKGGEISDDAFSVLGKILEAGGKGFKLLTGKSEDAYRDLEDSVGVIAQLFTNIPVKNISRDTRAVFNWFSGDKYAQRETSAAVRKYQREGVAFSADNLFGALNKLLGEDGYETKNTAYYQRILDAKRAGDEQTAAELTEYMLLGKGVKEETLQTGINTRAKNDESMTAEEKAEFLIENSTSGDDFIMKQFKDGEITEDAARKLLKQAEPEKTDDDIWWRVDRAKYQKETGEQSVSGYYYRLKDAVNANKVELIREAVKQLMDHGITKEKIKGKLSDWKNEYLEADNAGRVRIRDAMQKTYKALGYTAEDADKVISGWTKEKKKQ